MINRNDPCWCGSEQKWKKCHYPLKAPSTSKEALRSQYKKQYGIILKTEAQIEGIRKACKLTALMLREVCALAKEGVTTLALDQFIRNRCEEENVIPACLHYGDPPFPGAICTSLNEVICHGIPNHTPLKKGDIMNIDISLIVDGYYGDCSAMVCIGEINDDKKRAVDASLEALTQSIAILKPGVFIYEIGDIIEKVAKKYGCSVVNQFVAHGVGIEFHEAPQIPHHYNRLAIPLVPGMTFTIEPMINAGVREGWIDPKDGWTARTIDNKPSAQWEHTLLITEDGHEILTV
jgi:methionyl aminopeptidase